MTTAGSGATQQQPDSALGVYDAFVDQLTTTEAARKDSLQARGMGIVTSAGGLGALFFGFVTTFGQTAGAGLPTKTHGLIFLTLVLFALAAGLGVFANFALAHQDANLVHLRNNVDSSRAESPDSALRSVIDQKLTLLEDAQRHNKLRASALSAALVLEALAAVCLAVAVGFALGVYKGP